MLCLVTGGPGFISSHVVDNLQKMGIEGMFHWEWKN